MQIHCSRNINIKGLKSSFYELYSLLVSFPVEEVWIKHFDEWGIANVVMSISLEVKVSLIHKPSVCSAPQG